jgi:serine phosphatase RsbU (regulator of sigma subunit)/pSer/pThr/pTyr-binding forkhead associated (FHA) protein
MPSLILIKSPGGITSHQTFPLEFRNRAEIVIGRDKKDCDIFIDDGQQQVSRKHAVLTTRNGNVYIENRGRNGTFIKNRDINGLGPQALRAEDTVKVCDFLFRYQDDRPAPPKPLPDDFLTDLPEVPENESASEMTTIQGTVNRAAAEKLLDLQPAERLRVLLDISTALAKALELDQLLPQLAESLFGVFKQADRCLIIQFDASGRPYPRVMRARRPGTDDRFSKTIVRRCIETNSAFLSEDATSDAALGTAVSIAEFRIRSVMCAPLVTSEGKPLGAIQLDTQDITHKFRDDDLKLLTIVSHLASVAVEKSQVHAALVLREKAQREIELAKQVQLGFLPRSAPDVPGYEFFGFYSAAQTIGGDYYDYIQLPGGRLAVVLGDVAGKGVPAAMLMAKLSAEARFCLLSEPRPDKAVSMLNDQLVRGGIGDRFVTLAAIILNPAEHSFTLVNSGHQTPLRHCPKEKKFGLTVADDFAGLPLGLMEGFEYQMVSGRLEHGETVAVFTDGVTDARNPEGEEFGLDGVYAVADDPEVHLTPRPRVIGERLVAAVRKHAAGAPPFDDIALVCFGRVEHPAQAAATATRVSPLRRGD